MAVADMGQSFGNNGANDLAATNDVNGTFYFGRDGNDTLRGGKFDDILVGGAGDDLYFGGAGADQFRFYGYDVKDGADLDKIFDLNFNEGDTLVFNSFAAGTFTTTTGERASNNGSSGVISSYEGLANAINNSSLISYSQKGNTDVLVLTINNGAGGIETIHITGAYAAVAAFNPDAPVL